ARFRDVEIVAVLAAPEERLLAGDPLQAIEIDVAAAEHRGVFFGEIVADDGDQIDLGEERGGDRKVSRRASDDAIDLAERCFECVERDAADYENGHAVSVTECICR